MRRRQPLDLVRSSRHIARCAAFATSPGQRLDLPIRAEGLSEVTIANGRLQLSPDYDLLALLCERWLAQPSDTGWMRPTFYQLASALYGVNGPPGGEHYRIIRDSLDRLAWLSISLWGFNAATGEADRAFVTQDHLLSLAREIDEPHGLSRPYVRLAEWLRSAIDHGAVIRLDWRTLRSFDRQQLLAKRLWIYLQAEIWKPQVGDLEATWLRTGDRLCAALGMTYGRPRDARRALGRAGEAILSVDPRYRSVEVHRRGRSTYHLVAKRLQPEAWHRTKDERRQAREAIRTSLGTSGRPNRGGHGHSDAEGRAQKQFPV